MKKILFALALAASLVACHDDDPAIIPQTKFIQDINNSLEFCIAPLSETELLIWFKPQSVPLYRILLSDQNGDTLAQQSIKYDAQIGWESATLHYEFDPDLTYSISVQTSTRKDTILNYHLPPYQHIYKNGFNYKNVMALREQVAQYDISPSRETIFILDFHSPSVTNGGDPFILKKYNIGDNTFTDYTNSSARSFLRAINDDEMLIASRNYSGRYLGSDSLALRRYALSTGDLTFVDWGSDGYGRYSRVIDNHIMVTNPIWTSHTYSLIDLDDNSKKVYTVFNQEYVYIREYNWDHIYYNNAIVDPENGTHNTPDYASKDDLVGFDESDQYAVLYHYTPELEARLQVYHEGELIFDGNETENSSMSISSIFRIRNNKLLFHQYFYFSKQYRISGYYSLDLESGEVALVQNDHLPIYVDFEISDDHVFSIRPDGLYKLTLK